MDERLKIVCDYFEMNEDQIQELRYFLNLVRTKDNGFGNVKIDVKRNLVYKISCTIEGKPIKFGDPTSEENF
jgi:hypothetical protein